MVVVTTFSAKRNVWFTQVCFAPLILSARMSKGFIVNLSKMSVTLKNNDKGVSPNV